MNVTTFNDRRLGWRALVALVLVPLLVAGTFLAATWRYDDHLRRVQAAIVNNDKMVELDGQKVPLGRQLSAELVNSDKQQNFTWVLADADAAAAGLANGQYAAVVTIPENFSKAATSYVGEADEASQATISIQTSPVTGIAETALGQSVADAATQALNESLTKAYLDNVYIGFNTTGKQFVKVAKGARQLADGTSQLADGVTQASDGTAKLADGMGKLSTGGTQLTTGGSQLSAGGPALASGTKQLSDGLGTMASSTKDMPAQIQKLSDGTTSLATGIDTYTDGVDTYVDGINSIVDPVISVVEQLPDLTALFTSIDAFMADFPAKASKLDEQVKALTKLINGFLDDTSDLNAALSGLLGDLSTARGDVKDIASGDTTVKCPSDLADVEGGCEAFAKGVRAGGAAAAESLADIDTSDVTDAVAAIKAAAPQIKKALAQINTASSWLADNASKIQATWKSIKSEIPEDTSPNEYLLDQLTTLRDGGIALKNGGAQLDTGSAQLASGVSQLNAGVPALVSGIAQSADGASKLSSGVNQYTAGVSAYTSGVSTYVGGVQQAAGGATELADGMDQLDSGAAELSKGTEKLASGLEEGAEEIPSYSKSDREKLSTVVAAPVSTVGMDALIAPGVAAGSLLLVIALWLGALATYSLIKPVDPRNAASSLSTGRLYWRVLLPGVAVALVQAGLLTILGSLALHLEMGESIALLGVLALAGVTFAAVNHALAAWAGVWGRLVSGVMLLVTAAAALTYTAPEVFTALRPLSPASPALDATRAAITSTNGALPAVILAGWLCAGLLAGAYRVIRSRTVSVKALALAG